MKHGKRPTVRQKRYLKMVGLNPENWLIERDTASEVVVIHRYTGHTRSWAKVYNESFEGW